MWLNIKANCFSRQRLTSIVGGMIGEVVPVVVVVPAEVPEVPADVPEVPADEPLEVEGAVVVVLGRHDVVW